MPYEVGNLQIVFNAVDDTSKAFDKLASNLKAVKKAISDIGNIGKADLNKFGKAILDVQTKFKPFLTDIKGASKGLVAFNEATKRLGITKASQVADEFKKMEEATNGASNSTKTLADNIKTTGKTLQNQNNLIKKAIDKNEKHKQELAELTNEQEKNDKATKKGTKSFGKLFASLKRIALYRIIRTVLKEITSSLTETAKTFAQVDNGINNTMSQFTSSMQIIKLSLGTMVLPALQMITPIIQQIGIALANVANMVSQAMSTTGTYTKINTDLIKNYRDEVEKTGTLLDFDKFRVLNKQNGGLSDFLLPNQEVDKTNENVTKIKIILGSLKETITELFNIIEKVGSPALKVLWEIAQPIVNTISDTVKGVSNLINKLDELGLLEPLIYLVATGLIAWGSAKVILSITKLTTSLSKLKVGFGAVGIAILGAFAIFESWGDMNTWQRIISIVGVATTAILGLAVAFGAFHSAWSLGLAAAGIVAGIAMIVASVGNTKKEISKSVQQPRLMADGGIPQVGTLFYAGEAGAEVVYNNSNGQSGVANVKQLKAAFYQALVEYGNTQRGNSEQPIIVNLDGNQIYNSIQKNSKRRANNSGIYL